MGSPHWYPGLYLPVVQLLIFCGTRLGRMPGTNLQKLVVALARLILTFIKPIHLDRLLYYFFKVECRSSNLF